MRRLALASLLSCACAVPASGPDASVDASVDAGSDAGTRTRRVLYVTQSNGFRHDSLPDSVRALFAVGADAGIQVVHSQDATASFAALDSYDAVAFYTSGNLGLSDAQKAALLDFVQQGGGFFGFHSATDTYYDWPEYGALIGAWFDGHPWHEEVSVRIDLPAHPAMAGLPSPFVVTDEIYQFKSWRPDNVVLMSLDIASVDLNAPGTKQNAWGFPLAWTRTHGKGRVFYCALGHRTELWDDARFRLLLSNVTAWVIGK